MSAAAPKPTINIRFLYRYCNAIAPMRAFYTDGVGLQEFSHGDDGEHGWICYQSEGMQLIVLLHDEPVPVEPDFASQPGDGGGASPRPSISIEIPEADFAAVYERLRVTDAPRMSETPTWRQDAYWGWTVNDPMGGTVELYVHPSERPAGEAPTWPA